MEAISTIIKMNILQKQNSIKMEKKLDENDQNKNYK